MIYDAYIDYSCIFPVPSKSFAGAEIAYSLTYIYNNLIKHNLNFDLINLD